MAELYILRRRRMVLLQQIGNLIGDYLGSHISNKKGCGQHS
jgi:hypothetical protein